MKSPPMTLQQLTARVEEQALETAALRSALAIQFTRIAQMQALLDAIPAARKARAKYVPQVPSHNGNGRAQR